jgi:hypothetical protein
MITQSKVLACHFGKLIRLNTTSSDCARFPGGQCVQALTPAIGRQAPERFGTLVEAG